MINLPAASSAGTTIPQFAHWTTDKAVFSRNGWMFTCLYRFIFAYRLTRCYFFVLLQRTLRNIGWGGSVPNWMQSSFGKVFLINVLQTQRLKSSSFDEHMNICWYMNFQHLLKLFLMRLRIPAVGLLKNWRRESYLMVVTWMDTPKYDETLKFMYINYQPILLALRKVYQVTRTIYES